MKLIRLLTATAILIAAFAIPVIAQEGCNPATDPSCPGFVAPTTTTVPFVCYEDEVSCEHPVPRPTTTTAPTTTMPSTCNPATDPSCPGFVAPTTTTPPDPSVPSVQSWTPDDPSVRVAFGVHAI